MKEYIKRFSLSFVIVNLLFMLFAFIIVRRLNINVAYLKTVLGALLISLFISGSITVFKGNMLNSAIRTVTAALLVLPAVLLMRFVFGVMVFRFSFVIYLVAVFILIIYSIAVLIASNKYKKEEKSLNTLLEKKKEELMLPKENEK